MWVWVVGWGRLRAASFYVFSNGRRRQLGLNVLVVSRSVPKMEALKKDFEERHGKKVRGVRGSENERTLYIRSD